LTRHQEKRTVAPRVLRLASIGLLVSGCYDYRQLDSSVRPDAGTYVRVELTDGGTARVAPAIGPYILTVAGSVQSADTLGFSLSLQALQRRGEAETSWTGETLALTSADVRRIDQRRLSRGRSTIAATAFTAVGVAIVYAIAKAKGVVSGGSNRPPVPGT
jgi:hypothetical protein